MKRAFLTLSAVLVTFTLLTAGPAAAVGPAQATASYIVVFKGVADVDSQTGSLQQAFGFLSSFRYSHALSGFAARLTPTQATALSRLPFVAFVSPDATVSIDTTAPIQPGDSAPTGVQRIAAASTSVAHVASGVAVAVIDTGGPIGTNPDLNVLNGKNCINTAAQAIDDHGHGTHVIGTIAARNNGSGVVGVAPGTTVYAVKVLNSAGSATWSQVICGIDWVTANATALNIKVASMSLGGSGSNDNNCGNSNFDAMHRAICNSTNAGVTYVVAAGNNGANLSSFVPAAYPEVLTVTAVTDSDGTSGGTGGAPSCRPTETDDRYASFSNYATSTAAQNHTIAGPGVCIRSNWLGNGFNTISGTSMATPHVSGSVALCLAQGATPGPCAGMTPSQIVQKMRIDAASHTNSVPGYGFTGDPVHPITGRYYGYLVWDGEDLGGGSTPPTPDFSIGISPSSRTVTQGNGTTFTVTITPQNGFVGSVSLSVGGLSGGAGSSFGPNPATSSSTLTLTTTSGATTGTFPLTITGTSGTLSHAAGVTLVVNGAPVAPTAPGAPSLNTPTSGNGTVGLTWSAAAANGSQVTNYKVYRGTSPGGETLLTTLGNVTSFNDSGLTNGLTYYYKVGAVNGVGDGPLSNERSATPTAPTAGVPGAPSLSAATLGPFAPGIRLTWTVPASNGSSITGYKIYRSTTMGAETFLTSVGAVTTYNDTATSSRTRYFYKISAVNGSGEGPLSNEAISVSF